MKFVMISGASAVGKMTVGRELERMTGFRLFHNHMSNELVSTFFDFGTPAFERLVRLIRMGIFREVAASELKGLIFTYAWAFDIEEDEAFITEVTDLFRMAGAEICMVNLYADLATRLERNRHETRLKEKPSKRDVEFSEKALRYDTDHYREVATVAELAKWGMIQIDNTNMNPEDTARKIRAHFNL